MREIDPEFALWATTLKTNFILADIYDVLQGINSNLVATASRKKAKGIKPYPRPGKDKTEKKHIGSGALPIPELKKWIKDKLRSEQ